MNTLETLENFKQRLLRMAAEPEFRFKNTERKVAQKYMERRTKFEGYSAQEVEQAEAELRLRLPKVFRTYLLCMGKKCADLFEGSDLAGPHEWNGFARRARELMGESVPLPSDAVVFLKHQGYQVAYIRANGGEDSPVWTFVEGEDAARKVAEGFLAFLELELTAQEALHQELLAGDGYYLTVYKSGGGCQQWGQDKRLLDTPFVMGDLPDSDNPDPDHAASSLDVHFGK